nr:peroxidasin [Leptinotarsa decemlineata]
MRGLLCLALVGLLVGRGETEIHKKKFSALAGCPSKCYCLKRTVRCMKLDLVEVPNPPLLTTILDLRFNKIKELHQGTFKNNRYMVSLLLNNNYLTSLKNGVFDGLLNLQNLYLYDNRIRYLDSNVFQKLHRLERLYLHNNLLDRFEAGTFANLPSLKRLNLHHNQLKRVPEGAFQNLPRLERLRLDHNSLVCDCEILWLANMLTDNSLEASANCKYPHEMSGKSLKGMKLDDFHCKSLEIMEGPRDVEVSWGQTASFTCRVQDSSATVYWMRDHQEVIPEQNKYIIDEQGSLLIHNADENDGGFYECVAKNTNGEVKSKPAKMTVLKSDGPAIAHAQGPPEFRRKPETVYSTSGEAEVKLHCRVVGNPIPLIKWAKNGVQLPSSEKYFYEVDGLVIRDINPLDHGSYLCEAINQYGRIAAEGNLIIKAAPTFTIQPENLNIQIGGVIRLECVASGTPTPEIIWYKNDEEIQRNERVFISEDNTFLQIKNAQETDSSLYVCEARNDVGIREVSARINVENVSRKPAKLVYKPYNVEALVGSTIELPCRATGDPRPGITWQKDGSSMQRTGRFKVTHNGNLYIYKVGPEDQGRYECTALNDYGRDSAAGYLTVKNIQSPTGIGIGDRFVKIAFTEATGEVDRAINRTIDNIINNKKPHNPAEIFRIIRYPDAPARELARAAEVYERTLTNIRKHVEQENMIMNSTEDFDYKQILSAEHLDLIARLSGCMTHRLLKNCSDMCFHSKYRSIDGTCNNLQHPMWGASSSGFRRILKPIYEDGLTKPIGWIKGRKYYGFTKPSSRLVSTTLISTSKITPDPEITHMVMQWGQFLDHDLDHATPSVTSESWDGIDCKKSCDYAAPCYPMDVPPNDPRVTNRRCIDFIRSSSVCGSGMTSIFFDSIQHREQINQLTSYIDASQVYGFSEELAKNLRDLTTDGGRLREGPIFSGRKPLLPYAEQQGVDCRRNLTESILNCFVAGDIRANEQVGLLAMHTLWMREHNRIARELKLMNPHWESDKLYHESRKIVGAAMQHLTFKLWLPIILGQRGMEILGEYRGYNPNLNPTISNVFATAALRFGHTLINPVLHRLDWDFKPIREGNLPLSKAFFSPWRLVEEGGIDPLLRGLYTVAAKIKKPDENLNTELTETLFKVAHAVALDLAAMNIHRGRDHALPGYTEYRRFCNMTPAETFEDLKYEISDSNVRRKLKELYGHPGNIDVFVGGILEDQVDGGK